MLEWGSGYSTLWFSQFVGEYFAIEHNREWHQTIAPNVSDLPNVRLILSAVEAGHKVTTYVQTSQKGGYEKQCLGSRESCKTESIVNM